MIGFEVAAGLCVKHDRKLAKKIREDREALWKSCLKKAKGDIDKAAEIFYRQYYPVHFSFSRRGGDMIGLCAACGRTDRIYSRGMCMSCYQGNRRPKRGGRWSRRMKRWVNQERKDEKSVGHACSSCLTGRRRKMVEVED